MKKFLRRSTAALAIAAASGTILASAAQADTGNVVASSPQSGNEIILHYGDIAPFYGDIAPFYGDIAPFYGDIAPFYGDIAPFYGDIAPFYGDIAPFEGDLTAYYGDIAAFYGDIAPFYGDIAPFYGDIAPFYGDIAPFYGDIAPFYGDIAPFYGDIAPFYGDIAPFYGDIHPFYGDIAPFWGDIAPFWGDIAPFWGDIAPFYGDIHPFWGDIAPFYGDIAPFYGDIAPFYGDIAPFWEQAGPTWRDAYMLWGELEAYSAENAEDYVTVAETLAGLFDGAEDVFGERVFEATGQSFDEAFAQRLLDAYGWDLDDPASLEGANGLARSAFFLNFYDGLMDFTEFDRVDHWMATSRWSPRLAQEAGLGEGVTIGLVDYRLPSDSNLDINRQRGYRDVSEFNHGFAVAGLIGAAHDGRDLMGVAPGVDFNVFNPFDDTFTASWEDTRRGIRRVLKGSNPADIVNLSLGVSGWTLHPEWANVLSDNRIERRGEDTLFVFAAGNDGLFQDVDIDFTGVDLVENMLVVGSVNTMGYTSAFSNRPGTACLTVNGVCGEGQRLMDRFMVAPGELMLIWNGTEAADGDLGTSRLSGTSFSTPLVTGTAALVRSQWGWLEASDVADVLLQSSFDLGAPGVDEVYGWGLLNVEGSLSPLDTNDLVHLNWWGRETPVSEMSLIIRGVDINDPDARITVFEGINDTYRDFELSVSTILGGGSDSDTASQADSEAQMAEYAYSFAEGTSFSDAVELSQPISINGHTQVMAVAAASDPRQMSSNGELSFQAGLRVVNTVSQSEMRFGFGEGALALSQQDGFGMFADHRPETGGVNPILGFASGGAYGMSAMTLAEGLHFSVGLTETEDERFWVDPFSGEERALISGLAAYEAQALLANLSYEASDSISLHTSYTLLNEETGFLGTQGVGALALEGGVQTDAITVGVDAGLPFGLALSGSATAARTRAAQFDGGVLGISDETVSTAFQLTARRDGVLHGTDAVRFSLIQPLHVERGYLDYTSTQVVDRETGELGVVTDQWSLAGDRLVQAEIMYATPLFGDQADLSLFGRMDLTETVGPVLETGMVSGARFRLEF